jgi:ATP-dependent protease HslVU (ClpYQ) peptidase subunit
MASDTMLTMGDEKAYGASKMFHTLKFLVGVAGAASNIIPFRDWLLSHEDNCDEASELHRFWGSIPDFGDGFTAILVSDGGVVWNCGSAFPPMTIHRVFESIGSGSDFAMAAMECGRSAADAVGIACKYDVFTGGAVAILKQKNL